MDEGKLSELFAAAVRDAPPASFDERDIAEASRRVTARRRGQLVGGSGLAVVVLAVGLVVGFGSLGSGSPGVNSSAGAAAHGPGQAHTFGRLAPGVPGGPGSASTGSQGTPPMQGGGSTREVGPDADSAPQGCGPADGKLAVALANELPSVGADRVDAASASAVRLTCPAGTRAAALPVRAGTVSGRLIVLLTEPGSPATGFGTPPGTPVGVAEASAGRVLTVYSEPSSPSGPAPLAAQLATVAQVVAAHF